MTGCSGEASREPWLLRVVMPLWLAVAMQGCGSLAPGLQGATIWDIRAGRSIDEGVLVARLAAARYRLLGEIHDNPAHHRIRADLIRRIAATGVKPAVVFEQFDLEHDAELVAAQTGARNVPGTITADMLATAGVLDRKGWQWPMHAPVIAAALAMGLPVRAANPARTELMRAARAPAGAPLDTRWAARYAAAPWTPAEDAILRADIADGHCNKLPPQAIPAIARAQRMRDAAMAQALTDAATVDGAILIAGDGHVRRDIGVPVYLDVAASQVVSLGLVESDPNERSPAALADQFERSPARYDYVWLTDRATRDDPCAALPSG